MNIKKQKDPRSFCSKCRRPIADTHFSASHALAIPKTMPTNTSVGKCTYKYNLEKAINTAKTNTTNQYLAREKYNAAADAKAAPVWPEGKE